MTYREAKKYTGPTLIAQVMANVLSDSKHDIGKTIEIIGVVEGNPFDLWTKSLAIVDWRELKFFFR